MIMGTKTALKTIFASCIGSIALFAIAGQFILSALESQIGGVEYAVRFFSYFTILSNIMVLLCCFFSLSLSKSRIGLFFSRPQTMTAVTLYILIVGLIYNGILRFLSQPQGLMRLVDELLHVVTPLGFFLFWWFFVDKIQVRWSHIGYWLIFPLLYFFYTLYHGSLSGFYPYPFINVAALGMNKVLLNSLVVTLIFLFLGLLLIAIGKWQSKRRS